MHDKLNKLIIEVGKDFKRKNLSLVTAESCTGGGLAYFLSKQPEVSSILERGYVTYSNPSKQDILHVQPGTLQLYGAVSKEVAEEMAEGALLKSQAQISIAVTGVAGPDRLNKSDTEPGIVWICCLDFLGNKITVKKVIKGSRGGFIENVIYEGIKELKKLLELLNKRK